jgi:hypothetical protein
MNMDINAIKAAAFDKIREIQAAQRELQELNNIIAQAEGAAPAGDASQSTANDDAAKDEQSATAPDGASEEKGQAQGADTGTEVKSD